MLFDPGKRTTVTVGILFIEFTGIGINFNIIKTLRTEDLCVDMPATVSP
jgi:hypothetical protein